MGYKGWTVVGLLAMGTALTAAYFAGRDSVEVPSPPDERAVDRALDRAITTNQERIREYNDRMAKQQARDLAEFLEGCYAQTQAYVGCDLSQSGLPLGETEGNVNATALTTSSFIVTAVSRTGCRYLFEKKADGEINRLADGQGCRSKTW